MDQAKDRLATIRDEHEHGDAGGPCRPDGPSVLCVLFAALDARDAEVARLRDVLSLPILFHSGESWDDAKRRRWRQITGSDEATTKVMCDAIRAVRAAMSRRADTRAKPWGNQTWKSPATPLTGPSPWLETERWLGELVERGVLVSVTGNAGRWEGRRPDGAVVTISAGTDQDNAAEIAILGKGGA